MLIPKQSKEKTQKKSTFWMKCINYQLLKKVIFIFLSFLIIILDTLKYVKMNFEKTEVNIQE